MRIGESFLRARRFSAVAAAVVRILASYRFSSIGGREELSELHRRNAERILDLAVRNQGLLIKVCQILATRADLLPEEYVEVLSRCHDRVPPRPFRVIEPFLERRLGRPVAEIFRRFEREPIGAASLAQVHEAELWDGRRVAVKVQYPDIARIVAMDVRNLRIVLRLVQAVERQLDFLPLLDEIERYVIQELDFEREGRNAEGIAELLAERKDVVVPKIVWELTSRKILVMEFLDGIKVTEIERLRGAGIDPAAIAERLVRLYAEQILVHGLFHADPHPGNLFVQPSEDGTAPRLVLVDFGLVKQLDDAFRRGLAETLLAMLRGRPVDMLKGLGRIGFRTRNGTYEGMVPLTQAILAAAGERPDHRISDSEMLQRFGVEILRAYRANPVVKIPEDILLVIRVMGILGGLERQLGGGFDVVSVLHPYAKAAASAPEADPDARS